MENETFFSSFFLPVPGLLILTGVWSRVIRDNIQIGLDPEKIWGTDFEGLWNIGENQFFQPLSYQKSYILFYLPDLFADFIKIKKIKYS